jgi:hypothetical protein
MTIVDIHIYTHAYIYIFVHGRQRYWYCAFIHELRTMDVGATKAHP